MNYVKAAVIAVVLVLSATCWLLWQRNQELVAKGAVCAAELQRLTEDADAIRERVVLFTQQQAVTQKDLQVARQRLRQAQVPTECAGAVQWLAEELSK